MRTWLALDTATEACSAALQLGDRVLARSVVSGRDHTRLLPAMVAELLAEAGLRSAQLDGIICGIGPGSFAGVRIGVAYAKGLALVHERPVLGVSSLEMLAEDAEATAVLTVIDARLGGVYAAAWVRDASPGWRAVLAPGLWAPEALPAAPVEGPWQARGSGFGAYGEALATAWRSPLLRVDAAALPQAAAALRTAAVAPDTAWGDAATLAPLYLRDKVALTQAEQQARRAAPRAG
jgi:tRNA threonylcarbamoyladenosine biosynthesis protein TsaB